ncbi:MAG: hypothetical protein ACPH5G_15585 [Pseudooceanicola atlanticus]
MGRWSGLLAALIAVALVWIDGLRDSTPWVDTHWLFSYADGVVKRGLPGWVYGLFSIPMLDTDLLVTQLALAAAVALALALRSGQAMVGLPLVTGLLSLVAILSGPGLVRQLFADPGRFDAIGLALILLGAMAVDALPRRGGLGLLTVLSLVAVLVHEAFILWVAPVGLALWLLRHGLGRQDLPMIGGAALVVLAVTGWIAGRSYGDLMPFDAAKALLQARADFPVSDLSLMVQYRGLGENIAYTAETAWEAGRLAHLLIGLALIAVQALLVGALIDRGWQRALIVGLCLTPLLLFGLGQDHGRWLAMINAGLAVTAMAGLRGCKAQFGPPVLAGLAALSAVQLWLGPFGVVRVFPLAGMF